MIQLINRKISVVVEAVVVVEVEDALGIVVSREIGKKEVIEKEGEVDLEDVETEDGAEDGAEVASAILGDLAIKMMIKGMKTAGDLVVDLTLILDLVVVLEEVMMGVMVVLLVTISLPLEMDSRAVVEVEEEEEVVHQGGLAIDVMKKAILFEIAHSLPLITTMHLHHLKVLGVLVSQTLEGLVALVLEVVLEEMTMMTDLLVEVVSEVVVAVEVEGEEVVAANLTDAVEMTIVR